MARISLSICDLCKGTSTDELQHRIVVTGREAEQIGAEICESCYKNMVKILQQETKPEFPGATKNTPSEEVEAPVLLAIQKHYLSTGENLGNALSDKDIAILRGGTPNRETGEQSSGELLEGEVTRIKSNFTDAKRRQVIADYASKCQHPRGFSMTEDSKGIVCKDCGEKAKF